MLLSNKQAEIIVPGLSTTSDQNICKNVYMYMEAVTESDYFQNFSYDSYGFCKHFNMLFCSVWFTI